MAIIRFMTTSELRRTKTPKKIRAAVRDGEIFRLAQGIYCDEEPDDRTVLVALHELRGLVYTGSTAMSLYLDRPFRWPVEARCTGQARRSELYSLRRGVPERIRTAGGIALVSPLQAALDAELPDGELRGFLANAYHGIGADNLLELDLASLVKGRKQAVVLLEGTPIGVMSKLERRAFEIVSEALADLPVTVLVNRMVGNYCYDLVIPEAQVAVEIDSFRYHAAEGEGVTLGSFVKERWKDNEITHHGWVLQHYTDACIRRAAERVARDIRRAVLPRINRQSPAIPGSDEDAVMRWHPAVGSTRGYAAG
ncbi:MAG: hypothetical protein ACTH2Y_04795 [Corynebacterium sp.]|uniref:hypothetical protein n=1 Tax=unclassified Corynebacterium TaxID=2624378 RepID=UPI002647A0DA|nr:hypothetical protein [Corynebacterium sp.]MDN5719236.1 hypothetical protein [Corynebacterium sp.]MDN6259963.1 hypothetical protein [Corynebacterium sp.]MDN6324226.1 hypothetical protein [Corynebacterium sp.]MDN6509291.1 hypothetical protein [Corynebacterium sp.]